MQGDPTPADCVFIGDEVSAAGLRLAGLRCLTPAPERLRAAFEQARGEAGLVLISAACAAQLPEALLAGALREQRPLTLVIADLRDQMAPPDLAAALRRQLGMAE